MKGQKIITIPSGVRAPILGIPIPGSKPFLVETERFAAVMRMSHVTSWRIVDGADGTRWLFVTHRTGRVSGRMKFREVTRDYAYLRRMESWRDAQLRRSDRLDLHKRGCSKWRCPRCDGRAIVPTGKLGEREKVIARLEKELRSLRDTAPRHPLLRSDYRRPEYHDFRALPEPMRCIYCNGGANGDCQIVATGSPRHYVRACTECDFRRESRHPELEWHHGREKRRILARVTAAVLQGEIKTNGAAYDRLAELGMPVRFTYGKRKKQYQEWTPEQYWRHLPDVCLGSQRPYHDRSEVTAAELTAHGERRAAYAGTVREADALRQQIASLREMAPPPVKREYQPTLAEVAQ